MEKKIPFYKTIPFRNIILDLTQHPFPQENGPDWRIQNQTMNDYDLFICESGSAMFVLDEEQFLLKPGMALLVPPNQLVNAYKTSDEPVRMIAQHFMLYLFNRTDFFSLIKYKRYVSLSRWDFILTICDEIRWIYREKGTSWNPIDTSSLFMVLLHAFIEESFVREDFREERKSSLVLKMISIIEQEYSDLHLLGKLMDQSSFGYSHTSNIFKEYTGLSLKAFIIERRIEAAKDILIHGGSLRESSEAAGYEDEFYFSRIFRKYTGTSPRDFRKRI
jgi:AraC-like DNA-binding protein